MNIYDWSLARNTSLEIATAIRELSTSDEHMQTLWENPSPRDRREIIKRAWGYTGLSCRELYWGSETIKR